MHPGKHTSLYTSIAVAAPFFI